MFPLFGLPTGCFSVQPATNPDPKEGCYELPSWHRVSFCCPLRQADFGLQLDDPQATDVQNEIAQRSPRQYVLVLLFFGVPFSRVPLF